MKKGLLMFTLLAASLSGAAHADSAAIKQSLAKLGVQSTDIQPSPVSGMSTVLTDSGVLYVTNQLLLGKLNALSNEMIVYKAPKEQHVITVFTDITCGYCHKLHEQMSDYNALGITVRYLAFPRQGLQSQAEQDMKAIWCAKDRNKALDDAMNGKGVQPASCSVDIAKHYTLGVQMGVNGTPAMVLSNGMVLPGYQGPKELKAFLDEHKKQTSGN
ncbi:TPA: bifunctional protein-disulfide isomerase/oxidoreductase DsbC [Klebsiella pneumoniae]